MNKKEAGEFCGNCDGHNCYEYPTKIFCSTRRSQNLDPIVDALWRCENYNRISQECYCVREAFKAEKSQR